MIVLRDDGDRLGSMKMFVKHNDGNCREEAQNTGYNSDGTSGFVERPIRIEIHEVKEGIDDDEHEQRKTGDNKIIIVENIVVILEVCPVHKKITYYNP